MRLDALVYAIVELLIRPRNRLLEQRRLTLSYVLILPFPITLKTSVYTG
jgi:hypothetical protein